jgi:alkylation response protein AidB-like acyl-CoA dehydrogenase
LPAETLLGPYGQAGDGLQRALDEAIVAQCAETVGGCEDVLALCSEYLKTRKQFGVPIGSFQALQHRMADMAIETSQARASLHRGLEALATASAERRSVDVSGVKAQVLKSARFVTQQGIQLHGGYGITEEYRVGHHWRRLLLTDTVFGSQAHHLDRYARRIQFDATAAFAAYDRRA